MSLTFYKLQLTKITILLLLLSFACRQGATIGSYYNVANVSIKQPGAHCNL